MLVNEIALGRLSKLSYMKNGTSVLHFTNVCMMTMQRATVGDPDWRVEMLITAAGISTLHMAYATLPQIAQVDDRPWRTADDEMIRIREMICKSAGISSEGIMAKQVTHICEITNKAFFMRYGSGRANGSGIPDLQKFAFEAISETTGRTTSRFRSLYPRVISKTEEEGMAP